MGLVVFSTKASLLKILHNLKRFPTSKTFIDHSSSTESVVVRSLYRFSQLPFFVTANLPDWGWNQTLDTYWDPDRIYPSN